MRFFLGRLVAGAARCKLSVLRKRDLTSVGISPDSAVDWTARPASEVYLLDMMLDVSIFEFRSMFPIASYRNGCNFV